MVLKFSEDYYVRILLNKIKLKDIMTAPVVSVPLKTPMSTVAKKIHEQKIRHLPVLDDKGQLFGLMTQRDLYKIQPPRKLEDGQWYYDKETLDSIILENVMIKHPFALYPENSLGEAILAMVNFKYGCVLVVNQENKLLGIVTQIDILKFAAEILKEK